MSQLITGIPASPGIVLGPLYVFSPPRAEVAAYAIADPEMEWRRVNMTRQVPLEQANAVTPVPRHSPGTGTSGFLPTMDDPTRSQVEQQRTDP